MSKGFWGRSSSLRPDANAPPKVNNKPDADGPAPGGSPGVAPGVAPPRTSNWEKGSAIAGIAGGLGSLATIPLFLGMSGGGGGGGGGGVPTQEETASLVCSSSSLSFFMSCIFILLSMVMMMMMDN